MKLLGLDYGESKIGLALGDTESRVATPFGILKNKGWNFLFKKLKEICQQENVEKIIVGLPVNHLAKSSEQLKRVECFIQELKDYVGLGVESQNEEFTTLQAKKMSGKEKEDDIAAMLILQSYLDNLK